MSAGQSVDADGLRALPDGWAWNRLGDITEVLRGSSPRPMGNPKYFGGSIPWIRISDVTNDERKYLTKTTDTVTSDGAKKSRYLQAGSLILSICATVCVPKIMAIDGCIHDGFVYFPTLPKTVSTIFLYYYFQSIRQKVIQENRQGMTQVNLNTGIVSNFQIPLPPLQEQERIVERLEGLLSDLDAGEAAMVRVRAGVKRYKASVLKTAVEGDLTPGPSPFRRGELPEGWRWAKLGDLADLTSGHAFKKEEYSTSGSRLLQIANVSFGQIIWEQQAYLPLGYEKKFPNLVLKSGDILMALNRPILGDELKIGQLKGKDLPAILYQRVGRFDFYDPEFKPFFLIYAQSPLFVNRLKNVLQGVDQPFINKPTLLDFPVPLPPLEEQQRIVAEVERRLESARAVESAVEAGLKRAARLRQAVLRSAFEGRL